MKKEEQEPQEEPIEPKDEPKAPESGKSSKGKSFTVTDQGEHGYDNDGPFGIGMIKGK